MGYQTATTIKIRYTSKFSTMRKILHVFQPDQTSVKHPTPYPKKRKLKSKMHAHERYPSQKRRTFTQTIQQRTTHNATKRASTIPRQAEGGGSAPHADRSVVAHTRHQRGNILRQLLRHDDGDTHTQSPKNCYPQKRGVVFHFGGGNLPIRLIPLSRHEQQRYIDSLTAFCLHHHLQLHQNRGTGTTNDRQ